MGCGSSSKTCWISALKAPTEFTPENKHKTSIVKQDEDKQKLA